jgi:hypothetical protein
LTLGTPAAPDEFRLVFSLALEVPPEELEDGFCFKFRDLFELPVSTSMTAAQVREIVCAKANTDHPDLSLDHTHYRIRERNAERLSKLLPDNVPLNTATIYEKKSFAL